MNKPLRFMRPPHGMSVTAAHNSGVVTIAIAGQTHRLDSDSAYSLADRLCDSADEAREYWATRTKYKAPEKPAPEAQ